MQTRSRRHPSTEPLNEESPRLSTRLDKRTHDALLAMTKERDWSKGKIIRKALQAFIPLEFWKPIAGDKPTEAAPRTSVKCYRVKRK